MTKNGYRDCHIKPDLVLIYGSKENALILVRLGSHSEIFG
ncbi:type II toxin-antitoxin system mRNA interferase toxin, RelE/StbE family [Kingella kingae]